MDTRKILLVDDDQEDQQFFIEALNTLNLDIECKTAGNGQEAIDQLEVAVQYELIFLDLNMPLMNGKKCLEEIKNDESYKDIPVIIYSTTHDVNQIEACRKLGADFLTKPDNFEVLKFSLQNILNLQRINNK